MEVSNCHLLEVFRELRGGTVESHIKTWATIAGL